MKKLIEAFLDMWKVDYQFKTLSASALSSLIGFAYTVFNAALGIIYKSVWNGSISVYYVLLATVRGTIVHSHRKTQIADNNKENEKFKKIYIGTHILMIFMDICLIAPITYTAGVCRIIKKKI